MEPTDETQVSTEEANAEQEVLTEAKEDEVREKLSTELGLSEDDDSDLLDKLVTKEIGNHKKLSTAVRQKIDWRTKATNGKPEDKSQKPAKAVPMTPEEISKNATDAVEKKFQQRDLDEMDHSDSVKEQILRVSKLSNTSIRKAAEDPYIVSLIETETKQAAIDEAADNGSKKGKSGVVIDTSKTLDPKDFDLSTEEGRTDWAEAKKARQSAS